MLAFLLATQIVSSKPILLDDGFTQAVTVAGNGEPIPYPTPGSTYSVRQGNDHFRIPAGMVYVNGRAPFAIGKFDVTNAEYETFVEATGHAAPSGWPKGSYQAARANYAVGVEATDASDYISWMAKATGWKLVRPTVVQWSLAAGGTSLAQLPDGPVGSAKNRSGAFDMATEPKPKSFRIVALPPFPPAFP